MPWLKGLKSADKIHYSLQISNDFGETHTRRGFTPSRKIHLPKNPFDSGNMYFRTLSGASLVLPKLKLTLKDKKPPEQKDIIMDDQDKLTKAFTIDLEDISFYDLFNLEEIQRLQDLFADAHEVASIITHPDGTPITNPSNFTHLCNDIIRKTEKGCVNCFRSDAIIGCNNPAGPIIQPCLSGGLLDAGASITVGGKHIANWLCGQVRNEAMNEAQMLLYADQIGANREYYMQALNEVPQMSLEKFDKIAQLLFVFANDLSAKSYNKLQLQFQISEQERITKQLEENRENLFITLHSIGDGVISTDINGLIVKMNPVAEKLCGWDLADAKGKALTEVFNIIHAETRKVAADPVKKVLKSGEIVALENHTVLISRKGEEYQITNSAAPIRDKHGNTTGVVLVFSDSTEKYCAQKLLKESEEKYRQAFQTSSDAININRRDGVYIDVNEGFTKMTGFTQEDVSGKLSTEINIWAIPEDLDKMIAGIKEKGFIKNLESKFRCKDGSLKTAIISANIIVLNNEPHILTIARDITERKQAEDEIKQKSKELAKSNAEKDKFFSILAHDLRSPFNGFLGLTQIMVEEMQSLTKAEIQEIAVDMSKSATNLYRLLENLLKWSQIQQGMISFNPEVIQLDLVVGESIDMIQESANNKDIELVTDIPADLVAFADKNMLQSTVRNLVSNAVKFTPKGGKIKLSAKASVNQCIEIAIQDSGIGMNQFLIDNIFRFDVKTNRLGTENEPSTGLGLMLCKEFVEKQGGEIWVESAEGSGSIFHFTIPYNRYL
jgi:PAS domain S-box-containing protein